MILAIDMGNSNIVIGCIDDEKSYFEERLSTDKSKTALEYAIGFHTVLELYNIDVSRIEGAIISSVVPPLTNVVKSAVEKIIGKTPLVVGPGIKTGLNLQMDNPRSVGSDLIVDAVAGITEYGAPLILIDMGTATTMSVVDKDNNYVGGVIMTGLRLAMESLSSRASQLFNVSLEVPKNVIGKNTTDCMKSGIVLGNAACIDGMIDRLEEELGYSTTVVATGGLAHVVIPLCKHDIIVDDALLLKGLKIIYDKNK
ncbi:MAG: type III pantothenate kinase [Lachnospiraceae bacterium]|nr:type III pantothenate kinase [Clostridiales bacterium]MDY3110420.1 type III pantothenate kinase [Lachnospiraceae bacterium]